MTAEVEHETIIVGAGPAGASAAWELHRKGRDCLLLERETFPREKLCAGWITPDVLADLEFEPADYPYRFLTFNSLQISIGKLRFPFHSPQHSIRRFEFDRWLVERSEVPVHQHLVKNIVADRNGFLLDEQYRCRYLIGAGGTRCPVERGLFRGEGVRNKALQVVTQELEFPCDRVAADCHLWFFGDRLPGYAWYVPKADGYLNVGVGAVAERLKARGDDIQRHWRLLVDRLVRQKLLSEDPGRPGGYSYYLRTRHLPAGRLQRSYAQGRVALTDSRSAHSSAFLVGDSAGLATRDLCEGIGPAVRSGLLAARAILDGGEVDPKGIAPRTLRRELVGRPLAYAFARNN